MEEQRYELDLRMSENGIVSNAEALQKMISEGLKSYNYIVDETNKEAATKDRTKLNNLEAKLKEKRSSFEKNELGQWAETKKIIMDTEKMIKAASNNLKDGIDIIDEKEKLSKMEHIREMFNAVTPPLPIRFEQLYDRKDYDRKAMTEKKIMESMQTKIDKIVEDSKMMQLFMPTDPVEQEQIKQVYCETLMIGMAKQKADELAKLHKAVAAKNEKEQQEAVPEVKTAPQVPVSVSNEVTEVPKQTAEMKERIVVEFIATRPFYDAMNQLVAQYKPSCKVLERGEQR